MSRKDESQRTLDRAKAISKSREELRQAQPAPALYIIIKWNGEAAGEPYYKKSEADGVCDKFFGPLARVVEYEPVETRNGKKKTK